MEFDGVKDINIYGTNCIADISRGDASRVQFVSAKEKHFDVKVENGSLTVTQKSRNILLRFIGGKIEFKLILPKDFGGKLRFRNKNGGMYIKNTGFADMELYTENGRFDIDSISCAEFTLKTHNGTVGIKNLNASGAVGVKCKNGKVKAESVAASTFSVSGKNTDITIIDVRSKKSECQTSNGAIDASALAADELRLETANGKINAMLLGNRRDCRLAAETAHGSIAVDGTPCKNVTDVASDAKKRATVRTSNGDIDIRFV